MRRITEWAHEAVRAVVRPGDTVVDATLGNGHDALFLARRVGAGGQVYGFDVQAAAVEATRRRLREDGIGEGRATLVCGGHQTLSDHVREPVAAVMFNLGYLPGGDHAVTTRPATTLAALEQAWALLRPGGILSVVCYRGHPGGAEEAEAVWDWASSRAGAEVTPRGREATAEGPFLVIAVKSVAAAGGPQDV